MATIASKGWVEEVVREVRSEVELPRRSPAEALPLLDCWIWEAAYML